MWRGLASHGTAPDASADADHPGVGTLRRRQDNGELDADLDPATLPLVLLGAVGAPVVFPGEVRRLFGFEATKADFEGRYRAGLLQLVDLLRPRSATECRP